MSSYSQFVKPFALGFGTALMMLSVARPALSELDWTLFAFGGVAMVSLAILLLPSDEKTGGEPA